MPTDYDPIAEQYKRSKLQPWRTYIECFTLMQLVGTLDGKTVVDVACGEGFYTRLLRSAGASKITGIDLSAGMIELALRNESQHALGIDYRVGDARNLHLDEQADVAVAAYLLNYARTRDELVSMCQGVCDGLKPGGRFVTVNSSPMLDFATAPSFRKYGFETSIAGPCVEEAPIQWTFYLEDGSFTIENYFLDVGTHEDAMRAAGFREIRWHEPRLATEAMQAYDREYWATFLQHSPITFIECVK